VGTSYSNRNYILGDIMKRIILLILLFVPAIVFSEDKIGYVDTEKIINSYSEMNIIKTQMDILTSQWQRQLGEKKLEINKLKKELESKKLVISYEMQKEKEKEINRKEKGFAIYMDSIWGEKGVLDTKKKELSGEVTDKIKKAIEKIAKEQDFTIVFDIRKSGIIYSQRGVDLTSYIIEELNKEVEGHKISKTLEIAVPYIYEMNNEAQEMKIGSKLRDMLIPAINRLGDFEFTKIQDINNALNSMGITNLKNKIPDEKLILLSKNINVDYVIYILSEVNIGIVKISIKLINGRTGQIALQSEHSVNTDKELDKLINGILQDIKPIIGI